ncbi:MAG TPA: DUF4124 domain-containing protein [Gammaproteobacteria bacterium]
MRIALIVAGLLVSLVAQPQEIYRWVDKDGIVHYADQPGAPDAKRVDYSARGDGADADEQVPLYSSGPAQPVERPPYRSLGITSPTPDQVFFGGDARIVVTVAPDPRLRAGDELLIFIDGNRVPEVDGLGTTLTGLTRGSHFVRAAVADPNGAVVISSPQVTFHLQQASVATPPTGPNLAPRPQPQPGPPG